MDTSLEITENKDYGWDLYIEGPSTIFGSILNYVVLKFLGEGPSDGGGDMEKAHNWIQSHSDAT
ncbi:hypothetical protein Ahy_B10g102391 isoform A [Arachis hypogaea]|uniref:Squalene cyclase N-terminal domain-containing protein n=1 Tax=Arachis hypogaea TaxID=3818 RepID=A0A444X223_ARAHY|nr:hypothetical protein Ahy_B10g102391 isoform A [Arachis hypogaea]